MTDQPASKSRDAFGHGSSSNGSSKIASWRADARRSFGARLGALKDFVRERRWTAAAAIAIVALSGAGVVAGAGGDGVDHADALQKKVAADEKRVGDLDVERKRREDQLADLQKKLNAKESQVAETEEKVAALEKRRDGLQREVAELVAPVAPGRAERVSDAQAAPAESGDIHAASNDQTDVPPDESEAAAPVPTPAASTASVDQPSDRSGRDGRIVAASRVDPSDEAPAVGAVEERRVEAGPFRVFIHVRAADPAARERAAAVAAELRRRGVSVAQIRGVSRAVRRDAVRFFYDQDRDAIPELQDAVRSASPRAGSPVVNDFRSFGAPPRRGTIELWLS